MNDNTSFRVMTAEERMIEKSKKLTVANIARGISQYMDRYFDKDVYKFTKRDLVGWDKNYVTNLHANDIIKIFKDAGYNAFVTNLEVIVIALPTHEEEAKKEEKREKETKESKESKEEEERKRKLLEEQRELEEFRRYKKAKEQEEKRKAEEEERRKKEAKEREERKRLEEQRELEEFREYKKAKEEEENRKAQEAKRRSDEELRRQHELRNTPSSDPTRWNNMLEELDARSWI